MFEYKCIKFNPQLLNQNGKECWELVTIYEGIMYFKKQMLKKREVKIDKITPEWEEFIKVYRKINNNGSYSDTLIKKYHEVLREKTHKQMMEKLSEYKQHLEAFPSKPPLQVGTYLNQKRYNDTFEVVKVDYVNKWKDDMLKEQKVPIEYIEPIMGENGKWEATHGKIREMTSNTFQQMIDKYYIIKNI